jgi:hypothetical protein
MEESSILLGVDAVVGNEVLNVRVGHGCLEIGKIKVAYSVSAVSGADHGIEKTIRRNGQ